MPRIRYIDKRFSRESRAVIGTANTIIAEYVKSGFKLTLRQLYYQFVARGHLENTTKSYRRLGCIINDARLAGLIDWDSIEDRTRNLKTLPHWSTPSSIMRGAADSYNIDKWQGQPYRVEVWIEKEALAGVFERVCKLLDVPFFACRGYTSQSEMWGAAMRLAQHAKRGQTPYILHFGDHDPSGIDMTRDIMERMETFRLKMDLERVALNMDQVQAYKPPPNPAKETDARFRSYIKKFGNESWELDALPPDVLEKLVRHEIEAVLDGKKYDELVTRQEEERKVLRSAAHRWQEVVSMLRNGIDGSAYEKDEEE